MPCQAKLQTGVAPGGGADVGIDSLQAGLWVPAGGPWCCQIVMNPNANRAWFGRFVCPRNMTISKIGFYVVNLATANDPCDAGIYNADGSILLGSAGSTLGKLNAATGAQVLNMQAPIPLQAGQVYYTAFAHGPIGGTAMQFLTANLNQNYAALAFGNQMPNVEQAIKDAFFPLTAPVGSVSAHVYGQALLALQT